MPAGLVAAILFLAGVAAANGLFGYAWRTHAPRPKISYLAELLVGSLWAGVWLNQPAIELGILLVFFLVSTSLVLVIITDFFWQEISTSLLIPVIIIIAALAMSNLTNLPDRWSALTGSLAAAGFFLWQYVLSRGRWVQIGDVWIGVLAGLLVGWNQITLVAAVAYAGATVYALLCAVTKRQQRFDRVPLGSFLAWSALIFFLATLI